MEEEPTEVKKAIEGRIIKIVDEFTVVIDKGKKDGVEERDRFIIYDEGDEIFDLEGNSLGKLEIVKGKVRVQHVQEKFSVCKGYKEKFIRRSPSAYQSLISSMSVFSNFEVEEELIPLDIDEKDTSALNTEPKPVIIGDLVKQEID